MFTGIIETIGEVMTVLRHDNIMEMTVRSGISADLHVDQSVAHDGVCLTVVHVTGDHHRVQLVEETCARSTFREVKTGQILNLERAMPADGRFEGHLVQGHVDCTGELIGIHAGIYTFRFPDAHARFLVEKGSICVNGVSLTVAALTADTFGVAIIPYTLEHTSFRKLKAGDQVNLEFDILGKYLARWQQLS